MSVSLTEKEAYATMYAYLVKLYERTQSDDLGGLLGDMSTLSDGQPIDPAIWSEWLQCIEQVKKNRINTNLNF
jgi:hypothetical protein